MNNPPFFKPLALVCAALVLAGCASPSPRSASSLPPPDTTAADQMREHAAQEAQRLLVHQQMLLAEINKTAAAPVIAPVAPVFDPLEGKLINVAMSRASISQILSAFADAGNLNLIVDPNVLKGGQLADMHLRQVTLREGFNEVLRTYDVAGEFRGNTLRVNLTEEKFFSLNFLNTKTSIQMGSGGNVFGSSNSGGGGGSGSGSSGGGGSGAQQGSLTMSGSGGGSTDPYLEIETALKSVLGDSHQDRLAQQQQMQQQNLTMTTPGSSSSPWIGSGANPTRPAQLPQAPLATMNEDSGFTLNKMTGTLYVKARPSKMRAVEKMLAQVHKVLGKQVYVEAQLIDVQLSDNFEFGVDWTSLRSRLAAGFGSSPMQLGGSSGTLPNAGTGYPSRAISIPAALIGSVAGPALGMSYQGSNYGIVINALRSYGNLKVLSNPNVQVRNGTPALLSVGTSSRYVSQSASTQTVPGGGASTTSSSVQTDTVFSGVMVGVLPMVRDDGRIELLLNPMQSDVDPASLQLVAVGGDNLVSLPKVSYKGLTTTLNVGDGDVVVVGGLIDQRSSNNDRGAPGVSDVPLLGKLFGNENKVHGSRELVIVLRVRVL
ncbi:pilus (MSHA type) biogenesis protein MshL [Acidovorax sp. 22279]|nr:MULTISPECIES: pilus (MSHA type) biogenesis protein MshL [unclassified Acidovorax]MCT6719325.1 pilus (MSHA type) biogenesis protein MshL [Acidovorax sp. K2F]PIF18394.1 general secretion pathway protein D [Acidovorax sp. 59]PKW02580.1 general secretion pathway protein D [Acidovorax sp. 30]